MRATLMAAVLAVAGVAGAQEAPLTPSQLEGKTLYEATCAYCHGPRGYGSEALAARVGPDRAELIRRHDMSDRYIRTVVKRGLGNMPAYTPTDLTPDQLTAIVDYLRRGSASR